MFRIRIRAVRACALVLASMLLFAPVAQADVELEKICARLVAEVDARWGSARALSEESEARFAGDVVQRALWLRSRYPEPMAGRVLPVRFEKTKAVGEFASDRLVMTASGNDLPSLRVVVDPDLQSFRYHSVNDTYVGKEALDYFRSKGHVDLRLRRIHFRPHATSRLVVSWTAGHVGLGSNSGRVSSQLRFMSGVNKHSSLMEPLFDEKNPLWVETAVSAVDIPFHGAGPVTPEYLGLEKSLDFRLRYYASLHTPRRLPLVAAGRSGENLMLAPLAHRHPELFAGMIWLSGMHPTEGYRESMKGFLESGVLAGAPYQPLALEWFLEMHRQTLALPSGHRWWETPAPFKMPVLAIVGEDDAQVASGTREAFKRMARENPEKFFYLEVPGGGHDVFAGASFRGEAAEESESDKIRAARSWQYVYWFLKAKVLGDPGVAEPAYGWRYVP